MPRTLEVPAAGLVVLVGVAGSGKSTFARRHFRPTEVLSSDTLRGMVRDDESDQGATADAFAVLHHIARRRLAAGLLTVVDATNVLPRSRRRLVSLAGARDLPAVAVVLDLPEPLCLERTAARTDRRVGTEVVRGQAAELRQGWDSLWHEGFAAVYVLRTPAEVDAVTVVRRPLPPRHGVPPRSRPSPPPAGGGAPTEGPGA